MDVYELGRNLLLWLLLYLLLLLLIIQVDVVGEHLTELGLVVLCVQVDLLVALHRALRNL